MDVLDVLIHPSLGNTNTESCPEDEHTYLRERSNLPRSIFMEAYGLVVTWLQ